MTVKRNGYLSSALHQALQHLPPAMRINMLRKEMEKRGMPIPPASPALQTKMK
jgi:hypothetical protein